MHLLSDAVQSPKVAVAVSTVTTGSGLGTFLNLIPADIGKLATVVGLILSTILIITHLVKSYRDGKKHKVEMEILKRTLEGTRKIHNIKERVTD